MKLKTGDNVAIIAGKDRGKTGKVLQVFPKMERIVVEGVNTRKRHIRSRGSQEKGQVIEFSAPLAASNVQLVCPKCGKRTRVGVQSVTEPNGKIKKMRVCKQCKEMIG
ncbi:MAG: 50S ribosomal protein L24 [bacterium]|nr:50S ribosomal protein L24 [bacterium]